MNTEILNAFNNGVKQQQNHGKELFIASLNSSQSGQQAILHGSYFGDGRRVVNIPSFNYWGSLP